MAINNELLLSWSESLGFFSLPSDEEAALAVPSTQRSGHFCFEPWPGAWCFHLCKCLALIPCWSNGHLHLRWVSEIYLWVLYFQGLNGVLLKSKMDK